MSYISREAAIRSLRGCADQLTETYGKNDEYVKCLESAAYNIEQIPATDVRENKRGKWKEGIYGSIHLVCSVCDYECMTTHKKTSAPTAARI